MNEEEFYKDIFKFIDELKPCERCGNLTSNQFCDSCRNDLIKPENEVEYF